MPIELKSRVTPPVPAVPGSTTYEGRGTFNCMAGGEVEIICGGMEQFREETPEGKMWEVSISLSIVETDN